MLTIETVEQGVKYVQNSIVNFEHVHTDWVSSLTIPFLKSPGSTILR